MAGIGRGHHVLGIEHLLHELGDVQRTVLLGAAGRQGSESSHEEMKTGERNHVHRHLAQIAIQLTGETKTASRSGDRSRHQMVQITVGGGGQLQRAEADVVQRLVVKSERLIGVLDQLMDRQDAIVRLDDGVADLGGGNDGVRGHDTVGVFLTDLGDQQRTQTGSSATTQTVGNLKTLKAITSLGLLADNVQDGVAELGALGVVALGPVVTGTRLAENKVIGAEELTEGSGADGVHGTGLHIQEHGAGDVAAAGGLVEVDVDALQLQVRVTVVGTSGVDTVLIGDDLPEFGTDLVTSSQNI